MCNVHSRALVRMEIVTYAYWVSLGLGRVFCQDRGLVDDRQVGLVLSSLVFLLLKYSLDIA